MSEFVRTVGGDLGTMSLRGVAQLGRVCRVGHTVPFMDFRGVAQLVARLVRDQEVRGSSPRTPIFLVAA
jgi:hypothetical protein